LVAVVGASAKGWITSGRDRLPHTAVVFTALLALPHCTNVLARASSASRRALPRQGRFTDSVPEVEGPHFCRASSVRELSDFEYV
jgi:hypothetical protein